MDKWVSHFEEMAKGKIKKDDMLIINQTGRGLGTNKNSTVLYKLKQVGNGGKSVSFVSPLAQNIIQAKSKIAKRKRTPSQSNGIKRKTKRRKRSSKGKRQRKKTYKKGKKGKSKINKLNKKKKRKNVNNIADIFGR